MPRLAPRWSLIAAAAAALAASPAAAQTIRATALDAATGAPVAEALVRVEAADGTLVASGFVNEAGVVVLRVRGAGPYQVRAQRAGYDEAAVQVDAGGRQVAAELRLARRPFVLDTLVVYGRQRNERGRQGFERRRSLGMGVFLDSAVLEERSRGAIYTADVLRGVPGLRMRNPRGRATVARSVRGWGCMVTLVDGHPRTVAPPRELHHFVRPTDVIAVEVYREFSEVPEEFRIHAHDGIYACGVIAYWTGARW
jgi:hypothetical protein